MRKYFDFQQCMLKTTWFCSSCFYYVNLTQHAGKYPCFVCFNMIFWSLFQQASSFYLKEKKRQKKNCFKNNLSVSICYTHHMNKSLFWEPVIINIKYLSGERSPQMGILQENWLSGVSMMVGRGLILDIRAYKQNIPFMSMLSVDVISYDVITVCFPHCNSELLSNSTTRTISSASCQGYCTLHFFSLFWNGYFHMHHCFVSV